MKSHVMPANTQVRLSSRPVGMPSVENFVLADAPIPSLSAGAVLVETLYLSLDPYMRGRMSEAKNYAASIDIGDVVVGSAVGCVIDSEDPSFKPGEIVESPSGWQSYAVVQGASLRRIDPNLAPISTSLGVLGMPGLTAYFSTLSVGRPMPGDTVVVSGAGGAVGQLAGQFAKLAGCRVVGVAGSDRKAAYCRDQLGFDAVVNYKTASNLKEAIAQACPRGVDVYLDGVGGSISAAVNENLALHARVVIFGQISQSNLSSPEVGPVSMRYMLTRRARVEGFIVSDWQSRNHEALTRISSWLRAGSVRYSEHIVEGLENAPAAFIGMLSGDNLGKTLVKVR